MRSIRFLILFFITNYTISFAQFSKLPTMDELAGSWQKASTLLALPSLNSTQGCAEAANDILSVNNLSFPPITLAGGTGSFFINEKSPELKLTRWFPYQVLRKSSDGNIKIQTSVRMVYEKKGLLFHIIINNKSASVRNIIIKINLTAITSRHKRWGWKVPRDNDSTLFLAKLIDDGNTLLLENNKDKLFNCFSFEQKPHKIIVYKSSGQALWKISLKPKSDIILNYVLSMGGNENSVQKLAVEWADNFKVSFMKVKEDWQNRFDAMFIPGNKYFSGYLPTLITPDKKLSRMYYMSLVSLLCTYKTCFPIAKRVYISDLPQSNCTMMYFWDTREWATVLALLDPVMLKQYLESWLSKGIYNGYAEEYLTGTLQGPWYSANDYSIFNLLNDYLNVSGDRTFLFKNIDGKTILNYLDSIATNWKRLVRPGQTLADYGAARNLLECAPEYINEVASFNAANVWMMNRVAEIEEYVGNKKKAENLRTEAEHLLKAVLKLYIPGKGIWYAIHRNGKKVEVKHIFDFATIGLTIPNNLTEKMKHEMTNFVENELLTDHWMRAQSLSANPAAICNRPDHGTMGAYCAWPGETIAVLCNFNEFGKALSLLQRCDYVTYEGPFSQSRELMSKKPDAEVRISPAPQTYNASNGGSFAESIIRGLFGYQPNFLNKTLVPNKKVRGFKGELKNVRQANHIYNLSSTKNGIKIEIAK